MQFHKWFLWQGNIKHISLETDVQYLGHLIFLSFSYQEFVDFKKSKIHLFFQMSVPEY